MVLINGKDINSDSRQLDMKIAVASFGANGKSEYAFSFEDHRCSTSGTSKSKGFQGVVKRHKTSAVSVIKHMVSTTEEERLGLLVQHHIQHGYSKECAWQDRWATKEST